MKKRILSILMGSIIIFMLVVNVGANNISVTVNGEQVLFDVPPQIINDRTMVPMRAIFEALGAEVEWDGNMQLITAKKDFTTVHLKIGHKSMGVEYYGYPEALEKGLDVAPLIKEGRTLIPLRAVADSLDAEVKWIAESQTVIIEQKEDVPKNVTIDNYVCSPDTYQYSIKETINTTTEYLDEEIKKILEEKGIAVKSVVCFPNKIEKIGYDVVIDLHPEAKNKFFSLTMYNEVKATILSVSEVYKYKLLLDGSHEWYDGHHDYSLGDWQAR